MKTHPPESRLFKFKLNNTVLKNRTKDIIKTYLQHPKSINAKSTFNLLPFHEAVSCAGNVVFLEGPIPGLGSIEEEEGSERCVGCVQSSRENVADRKSSRPSAVLAVTTSTT
jgi:hypothetical protein